jgi:hypothetical protein
MLQRLMLRVCVALAALVFAPAAFADVGQSATGSGTATNGHVFSFAATGGVGGSATGTMAVAFDERGPTTASVRCLLVSGHAAVIIGTITSSPLEYFVGETLVVYVVDNATPGAGSDLWNALVSPSAGTCNDYSYLFALGFGVPVVAGEITVVGISAAQQLADLIAELQSSPTGPGGSYLAKLQAIAASLGNGNTQAACNQLSAFENEVIAQTGKKLTQAEANDLRAAVTSIKRTAGCTP